MKAKDFTLLMAAVILVAVSVACWKFSGVSSAPDLWKGASMLAMFVFAAVLAYIWSGEEKEI